MKKALIAVACATSSILSIAQPSKVGASGYSPSPFDLSAEELPSNFRGNDCRGIATSLKKMNLKKDEFESSAKYVERIESVRGVRYFKDLQLDSTIAFKRKGLVQPEMKYDADKEKITIDLSVRKNSAFALGSNPAVLNWDSIEITESKPRFYTGTNSFGASVRVEERRFRTCAIAFANERYGALGGAWIESEGISADVARSAKNNLAIFYVGTLAAPYIGHISEPSPDRKSVV